MFLGADVDGLDSIASECKEGAQVATEVCAVLEAICAASWIFGPFGAAFIAYLKGVVIPWLKAVAQALNAFSAVLTLASNNQKDASSATGVTATSAISYVSPTMPAGNTSDYPTIGAVTSTDPTVAQTAPGSAVTTGTTFAGIAGLTGAASLFGPNVATGTDTSALGMFGSSTPAASGSIAAGTEGAAGGSITTGQNSTEQNTDGIPKTFKSDASIGMATPERLAADHEGANELAKAFGQSPGGLTSGSFANPLGMGSMGSTSTGSLAESPLSALKGSAPLFGSTSGSIGGEPQALGSIGDVKLAAQTMYASGSASGGLSFGGVAGLGAMGAAGGGLTLASLTASSKQDFGDVDLDEKNVLSVGANGSASAGIGAINQNGQTMYGASAQVQAFAGVQDKAEGTASFFGGIVKVGAEGTAQLGIGGSASAMAAVQNGQLTTGFNAGFAVGPGLGGGVNVVVDLPKAQQAITSEWNTLVGAK